MKKNKAYIIPFLFSACCVFLVSCSSKSDTTATTDNTIITITQGSQYEAYTTEKKQDESTESTGSTYSFTGLASNENGTWYYEDGKIQNDKNGFITYNGHEFYIENGRSTDFEPCFFGTQNGRRTYLIGDSRTRQAYSCVYGDENWKERVEADFEQQALEIWKALGGTGFDYMSEALNTIIETDETDNVTDVIILSGFNDLGAEPIGVYDVEDHYVEYLNSVAQDLHEKGTRLYYVSVNPASSDRYRGDGTLYNEKIEDWNDHMQQNLDPELITYIDSYNNVELENSTYDGIHYEKEANIRLIQYVMSHK